ncbi:MAG TPA: S8 family serine peptidase [Methanospirillum sp.]|nr:S8 family serine peptidase [Methanospirillum sp.]
MALTHLNQIFTTGLWFLIIIVIGSTLQIAIADIQIPSGEPAIRETITGYAPSSLLVRFDQSPVSARVHSAVGSRVIREFSSEGIEGLQLIAIPDRLSVPDAITYYEGQPGVLYAEPDYYRDADRLPNDPEFWRQWGLVNNGQIYYENASAGVPGADIKATMAWDRATGGDTIVAVLDSGVDYLHPDLTVNIWTDPVTGTYGYDAITGEPEPMDLASHGTHCAGIIGAVGDNGLGIVGVNWNTRIMPVRFLNSFGRGKVSDEIAAILWATAHGAEILSCSYGSPDFSRAEYDLIQQADALFVCAAGNAGSDNDVSPYYPNSYDLPNIISVAATDPSDHLADFSNFGAKSVDLGAPGVDIYSTKHMTYLASPVWSDPLDSFRNWTVHGNWTIDTSSAVSPLTSARGTVDRISANSTGIPAILTLSNPWKIADIAEPIISYQWSMVGTNYSFMIEGSSDGFTWQPLEYGSGSIILAPFMKRECKIPADLRKSRLFIRFVVNGDFCIASLDDISLSDGYGTVADIRWGYMNGTSMACPQVSGMAALLASAAPDIPLTEIKQVILSTIDPLPDLAGKTVTGGRANLSAAIERITGGSSYHLRLVPGWNHISVPLRLASGSNTGAAVFGSLSNVSGHSLLRYDHGSWISVHAEEVIDPLSAYWVWTGSPASLPLLVDQNQSGSFVKMLSGGWNSIGMTGYEPYMAKDQLASLGEIWNYAIGFNRTTQTYEEPVLRGGSGIQNDTRPLYPYEGYWVYVTRNVTFEQQIPGEEVLSPQDVAMLMPMN